MAVCGTECSHIVTVHSCANIETRRNSTWLELREERGYLQSVESRECTYSCLQLIMVIVQ